MIFEIFKIKKYIRFLIILLNIIPVMILSGRDMNYAQNQVENGEPFIHRYVSDIEISPNFKNDQTVFSVLNKSGIYKSTDAGENWVPIHNGFPNLDVCDISISPNFTNDNTVIALTTTYDPNDFGYLMVSRDGGGAWQERAQFQGLREGMIVFSPNAANDNTIFFFNLYSGYVKISTDMGNSWPFNPNYSFPGGGINEADFSPNYANDNTILVATGASTAGGGLYESNDKGQTWERISRELICNWWTDESLEAISISPNFHSDNTLFVALVDGFVGTVGIWRTTDNGTNWDYLLLDTWGGGTTGLTNKGISAMVISPDFINDNTLFLGTAIGVYVSTDQAESWSAINNGLENLSIETMVISPNFSKDKTLFAGTHSGIFKSTNGGTSWTPASTGLPGSTLMNVSDDPYAIDTLPSIAADKNGAVHVIWMGTHDSSGSPDGVGTDIMYTKKTGDTFEEPTMITVPTEYYSKELSLAVDNDGFVHIAFLRMEDQLGASGDLYYVNNKNGSFENPQLIVGDGWWEFAYRPAIAVDHTGIVHIVFYKGAVYYINNSSGSFGGPVEIVDSGVQPDLTADDKGSIHIVYRENANIFYMKGINGIFESPIKIATDAGGDQTAISVDKSANAHIVYRNGNRYVRYINNVGGSFNENVNVGWGDHPWIVVDEQGVAHVVYNQVSENMYAHNAGGTFQSIQINQTMSSYGGARGGCRFVTLSPDGFIHTVFQAKANNIFSELDHDIFCAKFPANPGDIEAPVLSSPLNGAAGLPTTLDFKWNASGGVTSYRLQVSADPTFSTFITDIRGLTGTSFTVSGLSNNTTYSWRVNASNFAGTSDWSNVWNFTTPTVEPPSINLNRTILNFGAIVGGESSGFQPFMISNSGGGALNWSVTADRNWLSCTPTSGVDFGSVAVSVDSVGLSAGTYTASIEVSDPNALNTPQTIAVTLTVYSAGAATAPFGQFATPEDGSTVSSSIPVTGWVLDDIEVESVKIYREEVGDLVYIGDAVFVEGARPDVEQAYPDYPNNYKAGWGYMMLTNFLPNSGNGTFKIHAIAADTEGHQVTLGTKTITCDNANAVKPFGAIDTPGQGGTTYGSNYRNQGWVLTPMPNSIPTDGSNINVYIDGVNLGHPTYNVYRSDIAALFPGYANSEGALAYFDFDTTSYENGVHSIYWTAADDAGNTDGIGSRYFSIQNTSGASSLLVTANRNKSIPFIGGEDFRALSVDYYAPVRIKIGYRKDAELQEMYPDNKGISNITIRELEPVVIQPSNKTSIITGYIVVGSQLQPLPIGSTLDTKTGIFYWQPGPGFIGEYRFVFVEKDQDGNMTRKNITVNIIPKFSNHLLGATED